MTCPNAPDGKQCFFAGTRMMDKRTEEDVLLLFCYGGRALASNNNYCVGVNIDGTYVVGSQKAVNGDFTPVFPLQVCTAACWKKCNTASGLKAATAAIREKHSDRFSSPVLVKGSSTPPRTTKSEVECKEGCGKLFGVKSHRARVKHEKQCPGSEPKLEDPIPNIPVRIVERVVCKKGCGTSYAQTSRRSIKLHEEKCTFGDASSTDSESDEVSSGQGNRRGIKRSSSEASAGPPKRRSVFSAPDLTDMIKLGVETALKSQVEPNKLLGLAIRALGSSSRVEESTSICPQAEFESVMEGSDVKLPWQEFIRLEQGDLNTLVSMVKFVQQVVLKRLYRENRVGAEIV